MNLIKGIKYNLRGLGMGFKTPQLLLLGLIRFLIVILITIFAAGLILVYHQEILSFMWTKPENPWVTWLWYLLSWLLSAVLVGLSAVISFLVSQILFSVLIMDLMSRITEKKVTGTIRETRKMPWWQQFLFLIKQEIPRAIVPVLLSMLLLIIGWLTPLGPMITILSAGIAVIFLAWDNTDLTPARQLVPFSERFRSLRGSLLFHLGFGLLFLIPVLNILFLSFAPVGATLYQIDKNKN
ncbi:MAG: EI24 domain-containing protein [Deltaproteobacteria bacterium]|jgi:CysZ protein|nr:EI24 domain-containing protein [Deltaproteobacteria bacterium]MBW2478907.1 EI24 domain-containing protein [Deltaproteobacteria bacterium]